MLEAYRDAYETWILKTKRAQMLRNELQAAVNEANTAYDTMRVERAKLSDKERALVAVQEKGG